MSFEKNDSLGKQEISMHERQEYIRIVGAKENNLKNISIDIPRNKLVVITGISGSGKSSLAFDTIFAEGQRRYMETFGNYAKQFIGKIERPDVESIAGLSPVISIEQKTTGWNPRSTVGTITEVYDFLRLLYARIGEAYSYKSGKRMIRYSEEEIIQTIVSDYKGAKIVILAPIVRGRKGHYRELFENIRKQGFTKVRVDGKIVDIEKGMQLERFKTHEIEIVVDRIVASDERRARLAQSVETALKMSEGLLLVQEHDTPEVRIFSKYLMDPDTGLAFDEPSPNTFSFNSPYGSCPACNGLGYVHAIDEKSVLPDATVSINKGGLVPYGELKDNYNFKLLRKIAKHYGFSLADPIDKIPAEALDYIFHGAKAKNPPAFPDEHEGLYTLLNKWYQESSSDSIRKWAKQFMTEESCQDCRGYRLKESSISFRINGKHIGELAEMDVTTLADYFEDIEETLNEKQIKIAAELLKEIRTRIRFLIQVGLEYLSLNRPANTLSGGESQRTRLANQIGSELSGITYIMDEPSIGLHQRDNQRLIESIRKLVELENTVLVVEHDKDIMLAADHLIDIGPGAGRHGGEVTAEGTPQIFMNEKKSKTAEFLLGTESIPIPGTRRTAKEQLILKGATGHNLKKVTLKIPLGTFTCVTGVSGSGKSSLINGTLYPILRKHFYRAKTTGLPYKNISGIEHIDKVIEIDQSPIGRTPRSNPATYTKLYSDIRLLFTEVPEAKIRGYKPGRFSFNVKGGRCEECQGAGLKTIEMNFLPDVYVECPSCMGRRFNPQTLEILYKGKSIYDILAMRVDEAVEFFAAIPKIHNRLKTLMDVGLGYIQLGQSSTTLSGGEAQRVKLAEELSKRDTGKTLYILDEPTTGLHFQDIMKLLEVIQKLVDKGNTFLVIEHNMDVIKSADYIIDIGPEGGRNGGEIVAEGTPEQIVKKRKSLTGYYLKKELTP